MVVPALSRLKDFFDASQDMLISADEGEVVSYILHKICEIVPADKAIIFLPDETGRFTKMRPFNTDEDYIKKFRQYYSQFDPYSLISEPLCQKRVTRIDELIPREILLNSEYYNDFLKPQQIFHKVVCYVGFQNRPYAKIAIMRSEKRPNFNSRETAILSIIARYLEIIFDYRRLLGPAYLMENVCDCLSQGLLLLDQSLRIMYANQKGRQVLNRLWSLDKGWTSEQLLRELLHDCLIMRNEMAKSGTATMPVAAFRRVRISDSDYQICAQLVPKSLERKGSLFLVLVREDNYSERQALDACKHIFGLTRREAEMTAAALQGLTNKEIASRFFVAEITVKKHLERIYRKLGVRNRAELAWQIAPLGILSRNPEGAGEDSANRDFQ